MVGRPKGTPKTGGRQRGTPNKARTKREAQIAKSGLLPLDYMLQVLRNTRNSQEVRLDAATKAAPYVHPKLQQIASKVALTGKLTLEQLVEASLPKPGEAESEAEAEPEQKDDDTPA